jgi:Predicted metal-binding integral membrane protein (DUF2182)
VVDRPAAGGGLRPAFAAVRVRLGLVAVLLALAGMGWWWTAEQMRGMDNGPWTGLGTIGWFLGVWVVMMAAMMFPSVAPTIALYSRMTRARSQLSPLLFAAGYLITWAGAGLLAFAVGVVATRGLGDVFAWNRAGQWIAGSTVVIAAVYELTPLKDVCLGKCRSPLGFLLGSWRDGWQGALRMGGEERGVVCWLLLGFNGFSFCFGRDERALDGVRRWPDRRGEDRPLAPGGNLRNGVGVADPWHLVVHCASPDTGAHHSGQRPDARHGTNGFLALGPGSFWPPRSGPCRGQEQQAASVSGPSPAPKARYQPLYVVFVVVEVNCQSQVAVA